MFKVKVSSHSSLISARNMKDHRSHSISFNQNHSRGHGPGVRRLVCKPSAHVERAILLQPLPTKLSAEPYCRGWVWSQEDRVFESCCFHPDFFFASLFESFSLDWCMVWLVFVRWVIGSAFCLFIAEQINVSEDQICLPVMKGVSSMWCCKLSQYLTEWMPSPENDWQSAPWITCGNVLAYFLCSRYYLRTTSNLLTQDSSSFYATTISTQISVLWT